MADQKSVEDQLKAIKLEKEMLELEDLRDKVATARMVKQRNLDAQKRNELQFKQDKEQEAALQNRCNHKKGGWGIEGLQNGSAPDYAVNKMTYADGKTTVMCTRCQKEWKQGDKDFEEAMRFPTNNIPAASVTFNIPTAV